MVKYYYNQLPPKEHKILGCDIETGGLDPHNPDYKFLSIAFSDGKDVWIIWQPEMIEKSMAILEDKDIMKIFHNAKFDLLWCMERYDIEYHNVFDTFLAEAIIFAGLEMPNALKDVAMRRRGVNMDKATRETFHDHVGFDVIAPTAEQLFYMGEDVLHLPHIYEQQYTDLVSNGLVDVMRIELDVLPATIELERYGFAFDLELWYEILDQLHALVEDAKEKMFALVGSKIKILEVEAVSKGVPYIREIEVPDVNFNSPAQVKEIFSQCFGVKTETTNKDFLKEVAAEGGESGEFAQLMLNVRHYVKLIGYDYPKHINPRDGRIYASFMQAGTKTGRYSSKDPNVQQVPRPAPGEPNMRHLWTSDGPDWLIVRADYGQQEARVMAQMSGDKDMIAACNEDDMYVAAGRRVYGREITKEERQLIKALVLSVGYGAGVARMVRSSGLPAKVCERLRDELRTAFPGMAGYARRMDNLRKQQGYVVTATGRRRYTSTFTESSNAPVQGTAADMLKMALAEMHSYLTEGKKCGNIHEGTRVWHIVHDEICIHTHRDDVEQVKEKLEEVMVRIGKLLCPDVLHIAEVEIGTTWDK